LENSMLIYTAMVGCRMECNRLVLCYRAIHVSGILLP
jgi:hypothetical protein